MSAAAIDNVQSKGNMAFSLVRRGYSQWRIRDFMTKVVLKCTPKGWVHVECSE